MVYLLQSSEVELLIGGEIRMDSSERRRHTRLDLKLEVLCQKVGAAEGGVLSGQTVNVSTGGVLANTSHADIGVGDLLNVQLSVPPTEGLLEFGGRIEGFARVTRIITGRGDSDGNFKARLIAMQFCQRPQLSV